MAKERGAKSPYQKYKKRPHVYSEELRRWRSAVIKNDERAKAAADREWHAKHGIRHLLDQAA